MSRISIDVTDAEHKKLKALAALSGKSIKEFVIERTLGIDEANDVVGAVDYLRNNRSESSKYIFGFGISEGASALIAAASKDDRFAGIVIDSACGYGFSFPVWLSDFLPGWMGSGLAAALIMISVLQSVTSQISGWRRWRLKRARDS